MLAPGFMNSICNALESIYTRLHVLIKGIFAEGIASFSYEF